MNSKKLFGYVATGMLAVLGAQAASRSLPPIGGGSIGPLLNQAAGAGVGVYLAKKLKLG